MGVERKEDTYEGPSSRMLRLASQWPMSTAVSRGLPWAMAAKSPPAKASLVDMISVSRYKITTEGRWRRACVRTTARCNRDTVNSPGSVRVVDLALVDHADRELLDGSIFLIVRSSRCRESSGGHRDDRRLRALRDDSHAWSGRVLLGQQSEMFGYRGDVLGLFVWSGPVRQSTPDTPRRSKIHASRPQRTSRLCDSAYDTASVSFPMTKSQYGAVWSRGSLKNCGMNGAESDKTNSLSCAAASSAKAMMAGTHTVRWYPPT